MGFLSKIFVKKTGDYSSIIEQEVNKDTRLLGLFLKIYELKINKIKQLMPLWEQGAIAEIKQAEDILYVLPQFNTELQSLIDELLSGGRLRRVILHLIRGEFEEARLSGQLMAASYGRRHKLNEPLAKVTDSVRFLKRILFLQSVYLQKHGIGQIVDNIEKHESFYNLLKNEANLDRRIKQNMIVILREILELPGLEERNRNLKRKEIMGILNVPNVIGVYANLSAEWRDDKELTLFVMKRDGLALHYASPKLQNDSEVVETAVANTEYAWPFASQKMQSKRQEIMARVEEKLRFGHGEAITSIKRELQRKADLSKIREIMKQNFWKYYNKTGRFVLEMGIRDVAAALGMGEQGDEQAVLESIQEAIAPDCLVQVILNGMGVRKIKPLVQALKEEGFEMYCLTEGDVEWQKQKFYRSGASNFIDSGHLYLAAENKIYRLREILDRILSEKKARPIHVRVVDDKKEQLEKAMALREGCRQKGIELLEYHLKLKDRQADGTAFYNFIMLERNEHPDLILILDLDQVIANTDGAVLGPACENILLRRSEQKGAEYKKKAA